MKILIAHDWPLIRAGIIQILSEEFSPLELTETSTALKDFNIAPGGWDLAVVGIDATNPGVRTFMAALKRAHPHQRVLAVSSSAKLSDGEPDLRNFVRRTISLASSRDDIVTAILDASAGAGEGYRKKSRVSPNTPALSDRELEVLQLLAAGKNVKEVAVELSISASSISTYRVRMLRKLKLNSTAALIGYALKHHLVD